MMTDVPPKKFHRRPPKARGVKALNLVAATYQSGASVTLTFDRPVSIAGAVVASIVVDDNAGTGNRYAGTGTPTLTGPVTVRVSLTQTGDASLPGTHLLGGAGTGIVAVDDGGQWAGVTSLALPFP